MKVINLCPYHVKILSMDGGILDEFPLSGKVVTCEDLVWDPRPNPYIDALNRRGINISGRSEPAKGFLPFPEPETIWIVDSIVAQFERRADVFCPADPVYRDGALIGFRRLRSTI